MIKTIDELIDPNHYLYDIEVVEKGEDWAVVKIKGYRDLPDRHDLIFKSNRSLSGWRFIPMHRYEPETMKKAKAVAEEEGFVFK